MAIPVSCGVFKGDTKLETFLAKNPLMQRKSLKFANCQKVPSFDFQSQLSMSKITDYGRPERK
jgi:hypothetical protein